MAHIYSPNIAAVALDAFAHQWQQIRAMLKAGFLLKHSSDATNKASANASDPANCKWVAPANVTDHSADGTATIGAKTGKDYAIGNLLTAMVVPTTTNRGGSEGNILVITNAANPGNNTTWLITKVTDTSNVMARPLVPAAHTTAGAPGTTITVHGHIRNCPNVTTAIRIQPATTGALGTATVKFSIDDGSTYSTPVTIPTTGVVEIIDVNGVATGLYIVVAGSITSAGLGTDYWRIPWAVASDGGAAIRWVEKSWLTSTYSAMANGAWICLEGPCTLKIPFTVAPTGTFERGETVTQTTTGATGELLGVTYEPSTGAGYMVIMPRLMGSGTGPEGWGSGYVITGGSSGATVTSSAGTIVRLVREFVFQRGNTLFNGTIYYQPILDATENSSRFGWLALAASGCTATICPGEGGTNNSFPAVAYALVGTGGSASHKSDAWMNTTYTTTNTMGKLQSFVANAIENANQSADGTFIGIIGQPTTSATSMGGLPYWGRVDNQEDGDLEPYSGWAGSNNTNAHSRTAYTTASANSDIGSYVSGIPIGAGGYFHQGYHASWRRRGLASGDAYQDYAQAIPWFVGSFAVSGSLIAYTNAGSTDPDTVACTAMTTQPKNMEPIILFSGTANARHRKGTVRWIYLATGTNAYDTWNSKTLLQVGGNNGFTNDIRMTSAFVPYDGSTTPVQ